MTRVEFISYTGKQPRLCRGVLTLKIDGNIVKFGHESNSYIFSENRYNDDDDDDDDDDDNDDNYDLFWHSGGNCGFTDNYSNSYVNRAPWYINIKELPKQYQNLIDEIREEINNNIPWGCCGGCL